MASYFINTRPGNYIDRFWEISEKYNKILNRNISHVDSRGLDGSYLHNTRRYSESSKKTITGLMHNAGVKYLGFFSRGDDKDYIMSPIIIDFNDNRVDESGFGTIFSQFYDTLFDDEKNVYSFVDDFLGEIDSVVELCQSVIHPMPGNFMPSTHFSGGFGNSAYLPEEEEAIQRQWFYEGYRCKELIRSAYWGNLLSNSHFNNDARKQQKILTALEKYCRAIIRSIDKERVFIHAPFSPLNPDHINELAEYRSNFKRIFRENGIKII